MAKTFLQIQKQITQLQKEAEQLRKQEADGVLARIKEAISVYGFTAEDLGVGRPSARGSKKARAIGKVTKTKRKTGPSSAVKFKDDAGNIWGGRGPRPAWFKAALESGKTPNDLLA